MYSWVGWRCHNPLAAEGVKRPQSGAAGGRIHAAAIVLNECRRMKHGLEMSLLSICCHWEVCRWETVFGLFTTRDSVPAYMHRLPLPLPGEKEKKRGGTPKINPLPLRKIDLWRLLDQAWQQQQQHPSAQRLLHVPHSCDRTHRMAKKNENRRLFVPFNSSRLWETQGQILRKVILAAMPTTIKFKWFIFPPQGVTWMNSINTLYKYTS